METTVHLKFGDETLEFPTIGLAAVHIKRKLRLRKLDAFVMAFWDEGENNSRPCSPEQQKTKASSLTT